MGGAGVRAARARKSAQQKYPRLLSLARLPPSAAQASSLAQAGEWAARLGSESQYSAVGGARRGAARSQARNVSGCRSRSEGCARAPHLHRDVQQHCQARAPRFQEVNPRTARAAGGARACARRARAKARSESTPGAYLVRARLLPLRRQAHLLQLAHEPRDWEVSHKTARSAGRGAARRARTRETRRGPALAVRVARAPRINAGVSSSSTRRERRGSRK